MLETLLALKNNDVRKIPGYDPEPVERLRKLQRGLVSPPLLLPGTAPPSSLGSPPLLLTGDLLLLPGEHPPPPWEHASLGAPFLPAEPSSQRLCSLAALSRETPPADRSHRSGARPVTGVPRWGNLQVSVDTPLLSPQRHGDS